MVDHATIPLQPHLLSWGVWMSMVDSDIGAAVVRYCCDEVNFFFDGKPRTHATVRQSTDPPPAKGGRRGKAR
jgi:hypothetical protein